MHFTLIFFLIALKQRHKYSLKIKNLLLYIHIIQILYLEGFIRFFYLNKKTQDVYIFTRKELFKNYKTISTISANTFFLNHRNVFIKREKGLTFFLSTNKGLFTLLNCKKYHVGGQILFKI